MKGKSKFKKLISFLLVLMIIISTVPMSVSAAAAESVSDVTEKVGEAVATESKNFFASVGDAMQKTSQKLKSAMNISTSEDFTYGLRGDGTAIITGYIGTASEVRIPSQIEGHKVEAIDEFAFHNCNFITSVIIPDSVTEIYNGAFNMCTSLSSIKMSANIEIAVKDAFINTAYYDNESNWNSGVLYIDNLLVDAKNDIQGSYKVVNGTTCISIYAFDGCDYLKEVIIADTVKFIGGGAFQFCDSLENIILSNSVTKIEDGTFDSCRSLENIIIPDSVVSIGSRVFDGTAYYNRESNWENGALYIGNALVALKDSINGDFYIKDDTEIIADGVFSKCKAIENIKVGVNNKNYTDIDGVLFSKDKTTIIAYPVAKKAVDYAVPEGVINVGNSAFESNTILKNIVLPNSVENIGDNAFSECTSLNYVTFSQRLKSIGDFAFLSCESLITIDIPNNVTVVGRGAFNSCFALQKVEFSSNIKNIESYTFAQCVSLKNVVLPDCVTNTGHMSFAYCTALESIELSDEMKSVGSFSFLGCQSLKNIELPDNLNSIGMYAFQLCISLNDIFIPKDVINIGMGAFVFCSSMKSIKVSYDNKNYCDIDGVLFNKDKTQILAYPNGKSNTYEIPYGTIDIGSLAFADCYSLESVLIPNSVTNVSEAAFLECTQLNDITIPDSVVSIGEGAFSKCVNLLRINVSDDNQYYCDVKGVLFNKDKTEIIACPNIGSNTYEIPQGVQRIAGYAFDNYINLTCLLIPGTITSIGEYAFNGCDSLKDVYYPNGPEHWDKIKIEAGNEELQYANIHYNLSHPLQLRFSEQFIFLDEGDSCDLKVFFGDKDVTSDTAFENFNKDAITMSADGKITARSEGVARIYGTYNSGGERYGADCYVCVGTPNAMNLTAKYDSKYYAYDGGGFYSTSSSVSDSIDLYLLMENAVRSELGHLVNPEDYPDHFKDIKPITLTAQISGSGLSFSPDTYQNTYTATYETIPVDYAVDDLLSLYPWNLDLNLSGNNYNVTVTLTSESFAPITENYSFTVTSEAAESVQNHLRFMAGNKDYNVLRQNIYGSSMIELKNDPEYIWSKYSTLDFDNYYDIVLADILIKILDVKQIEMPSLIPDFVKDCVSNFKTVTSGLKVIVNDSYDEVLDLSEQEVGKILKKSKYKEDDIKFTDKVYKSVLEHCSKPANKEKIEKVVGGMKGAGKFISAVKLGANVIQSVVDWGNRLALLNAFSNADQAFKNVMKTFADSIPSSEYKMKESVYDYINYSQDWTGKMSEIQEITDKLLFDVSMEVLKKMIGKSFFEFVGHNVLGWLGMSTISGGTAVFASTAAFSGVSSAFGAFFTGVSLGLCLSDHLCDSSGKSEEMSKIVAMSEYSTYITNTLYYYEQKLWNDAVNATEETGSIEAAVATVDEFEYAFLLQKTSQSYIMEHTVSALEKKAGSIIGRRLDRNDYPSLISEILAQKSTVDNLRCHTDSLEEPTEVTQTKVIAIHCPVDVFVTGADGSELVRIVNDTVEYAAEGINVIVVDGEKYIAVPANQKFDVRIVAREAGSMSYSVTEYGEGAQRVQTVGISEITLKDGAEFNADIPQGINNSSEDYSVKENGTVISPDEIISIPVTGIEIDKNSLNLDVGETYKLNAAVLPSDASNQNVIWYSDNPSVASVDENGMVTAVSNGQTTVYAVSEEWGYMAVCTVTVSGGSGAVTGDINGDGKVTAIDARWVLQIAAGIREVNEEEKASADLNKDGKVTAIDARWVLQIAAGTRKVP